MSEGSATHCCCTKELKSTASSHGRAEVKQAMGFLICKNQCEAEMSSDVSIYKSAITNWGTQKTNFKHSLVQAACCPNTSRSVANL